MNLSFTSNSEARAKFPAPTPAACVAVLILAVVRVLIGIAPDYAVTHIDSRLVKHVFVNDGRSELNAATPPKVVLLGTSRTQPLKPRMLENLLNLSQREVVNLALPGTDFLMMETTLRRNPRILQSAEVLLIDIVPLQAMLARNPIERSEFFLRFATLNQRIHARSPRDKIVALADFALPFKSHAQEPYQWRTSVGRLAKTKDERRKSYLLAPEDDFQDWKETVDVISRAEQRGERTRAVLDVLFKKPIVVPNEVFALERILEAAPERCRIIFVWLPFRQDTWKIVEDSEVLSESRDTFKSIIRTIDDPRLEVHWFERPEDIGLAPGDYADDGAHFRLAGIARIAETYAELARAHL